MKKIRFFLLFFFAILFIYFVFNTNFTFISKTQTDYFNPAGHALLAGRLDVKELAGWGDTLNYQGKIYLPWGILTPLVFAVLQRMTTISIFPVPILHLGLASLNVYLVYLLLKRLQRDFFPTFGAWQITVALALYAFGTTSLFVGTVDQVWFTDQLISSTLGILGTYFIFKKDRMTSDYLRSIITFSLAILGRATVGLLLVIPGILYLADCIQLKKNRATFDIRHFVRGIPLFGLPFALGVLGYTGYNFARFGDPFEFGFRYVEDNPVISPLREEFGVFSLLSIPRNAWYFLFEIPRVSWINGKIDLGFNGMGNSIFLLSPPLLAIFLANPIKKIPRLTVDPYVLSLWVGAVITTIPSLMFYGSGWFQFGYRFSQDITHLLILLSVFGMKGKINVLYVAGTIVAIILWVSGVGLFHAAL